MIVLSQGADGIYRMPGQPASPYHAATSRAAAATPSAAPGHIVRDDRWGQVITYLCTVAAVVLLGLAAALTFTSEPSGPAYPPPPYERTGSLTDVTNVGHTTQTTHRQANRALTRAT